MIDHHGHVAVVGGGAWGSALAIHAARVGLPTRLWIREEDLVRRLAEHRDNPAFLPGVRFPDGVSGSGDLDEVVGGARLVVLAVPTRFARAVLREAGAALAPSVPVVVATKGIEEESLALPLDLVAAELGDDRPAAVLSGPSFAAEVARGHATAVVVASPVAGLAAAVQALLSSAELRLYTNGDPVGVQLGGALKNVIAIAGGVSDGLGMGLNARAALITRGLAEMTRLGVPLGARPATLAGLAGLGDLVLTCTGDLSRNRTLGRRLGAGERLEDILASSRSVAEGVGSARSAHALARREGVSMPIVDEVYRIVAEDGDPQHALERLTSRPPTAEDTHAERGPA